MIAILQRRISNIGSECHASTAEEKQPGAAKPRDSAQIIANERLKRQGEDLPPLPLERKNTPAPSRTQAANPREEMPEKNLD
jgi:hypothetical protein